MDKHIKKKTSEQACAFLIPEFILESSDSCSSDVSSLVIFICIIREIAFGCINLQFHLLVDELEFVHVLFRPAIKPVVTFGCRPSQQIRFSSTAFFRNLFSGETSFECVIVIVIVIQQIPTQHLLLWSSRSFPALAVTHRALAPVVECLTPAPVVTNEAPTPRGRGHCSYACRDLHCARHDRFLLCTAYRAPRCASPCGDQRNFAVRRGFLAHSGSHHQGDRARRFRRLPILPLRLFSKRRRGESTNANVDSVTRWPAAYAATCRDRHLFVLLYVRALCMASHHPSFTIVAKIITDLTRYRPIVLELI